MLTYPLTPWGEWLCLFQVVDWSIISILSHVAANEDKGRFKVHKGLLFQFELYNVCSHRFALNANFEREGNETFTTSHWVVLIFTWDHTEGQEQRERPFKSVNSVSPVEQWCLSVIGLSGCSTVTHQFRIHTQKINWWILHSNLRWLERRKKNPQQRYSELQRLTRPFVSSTGNTKPGY